MSRIPISFSKVVANYPDQAGWPTKKLLDTIGGDLRARLQDNINTCAIRLSYALNASGIPIRREANVAEWAGAPASHRQRWLIDALRCRRRRTCSSSA